MDNVRHITTARGAPAASDRDPAEDIVARLDKETNGNWSFDVADNDVMGDEVVVLGRLTIGNVFRIGYGACSMNGSTPMVTKLRMATMDALAQAAMLFGIRVVGDDVPAVERAPVTAERPTQAPTGGEGTRITRKQLDYLYALGRDRKIPRDRMAERCLSEFKKKPEYLTKAEASALIEALRGEEPS